LEARFIKFILDEIYPGGRLPLAAQVTEHATTAGYIVTHEQHLQPHYVRTLDTWATNLEAAHEEAVAATSEEVYDRDMRYLIGCSDFFRRGISELGQFTLTNT
jgi:cyclopropane-fatty-acyl-phospholipid synthase